MKQFFAPISKINKKTREVSGILALEVKDKAGEIMDYDASKPYFESWSKGIQKGSGGKSVGNLRLMHDPVIAGKFTEITFNDDKKQIEVVSKVSNDTAWNHVLEGEVTGFSIQGDYIWRKKDAVQKARRYAVRPVEGSLVDNPCMYGADFTEITENGEAVARKFAGNTDPEQFWFCKKENCDLYHKNKEDAASCTGIVAKSFSDDDLEEEFDHSEESVSKSMYDVSSLASNISSLRWVNVDDGNKKKFGKAVAQLFSVLSGMVKVEKDKFEESLNELDGAVSEMKSAGLNLLNEGDMKLKVKKFAAADKETEDDLYVEFDEKAITETIAKAAGVMIKEVFADLKEDIEALSSAVVKVSGLPKKSKVVTKAADRKRIIEGDEEPESKKVEKIVKTADTEDQDLRNVMKSAFASPKPVRQIPDENQEEIDEEEPEEE